METEWISCKNWHWNAWAVRWIFPWPNRATDRNGQLFKCAFSEFAYFGWYASACNLFTSKYQRIWNKRKQFINVSFFSSLNRTPMCFFFVILCSSFAIFVCVNDWPSLFEISMQNAFDRSAIWYGYGRWHDSRHMNAAYADSELLEMAIFFSFSIFMTIPKRMCKPICKRNRQRKQHATTIGTGKRSLQIELFTTSSGEVHAITEK